MVNFMYHGLSYDTLLFREHRCREVKSFCFSRLRVNPCGSPPLRQQAVRFLLRFVLHERFVEGCRKILQAVVIILDMLGPIRGGCRRAKILVHAATRDFRAAFLACGSTTG